MTESELMNDRETVYERCKHYISRHSIGHASKRAVKEQQLKLAYCAHANMSVEQVDRALKALEEQGVIVRAGGWMTINAESDDWFRQVIQWCVDREDSPRELIGELNGRVR